METVKLLETLSNAFGPSGFEGEVRAVLEGLVRPLADEVRTDTLGNLIATRRGPQRLTLMLDAHMDEVGLIVSHVDERGFLRVAPLGGWDARVLPAQALTIQTRAGEKRRGIIGSAPPHILKPEEREKAIKLEDLFVDVGAASAEEVQEMGLRVGDPAVIHHPFEQVTPQTVMGKAFDDRAGCAVLVKVLESLQGEELPGTLVANFAVGEETGARGARTAAFQIRPQLALALEGTIGADLPGLPITRQPTALGKGPAISVADRTLIVPRQIVIALEELAGAHGIPYQHKMPLFGGTDAGAIHQTRGGVRCGVLSVPCRYIHAPLSLMRLSDFEYTVQLARAFVLEGPQRLGLV